MRAEQIRTIVLGIFQHEGRLLVFEGRDPVRGVTFYRPLGGGIQFGEYGHQALAREIREELGAEITDVRYLDAIQNIFTHAGRQGHEIALLYEARFTDPACYGPGAFAGAQDDGVPITVSWKPLADFENGAFLVPVELLGILRRSQTIQGDFRRSDDEAARRGHPSYVWRAGQERRLALVRQWAELDGARILDAGCGVGMYTDRFHRFSPHVIGVEIDPVAAAQAQARGLDIVVASAEALPFADASFDVVFSHEVIEHVADDRHAAAEMARVLAPGGRIVLFCPNRLYPFETHGHYWRGRYHFGNTPLINWLPDRLRNRLAPHVRAYTGPELRRLFEAQPVRIIHHQVIYPGFDNIVATRPQIGRWLRKGLYCAEHTPFQVFGLSHLLVLEKTP